MGVTIAEVQATDPIATLVVIIILAVAVIILIADRMRGARRRREEVERLSQAVGDRLAGSLSVFGEVREKLGELSKRTRDIEEVGKSIASLQEALRSPKFRGGFGELGLERLLTDNLPRDTYALQYRFRNGDIVDAVVRLGKNLVPIDAKFPFPLEDFEKMVTSPSPGEQAALRRQFTRTIKRHIDNVAKYILPDENTFGFALMYIPAENVYYETIIRCPEADSDDDLHGYCLRRRVFPVSPNSFYAYLQAIVLGLKGLEVEKSAQELLGRLERIQVEFASFGEDYALIGRHLARAAAKHAEGGIRLNNLSHRLELLTGESTATKLPDAGEDEEA
jgi:DNA recombination protein RmuC